MLSKNKFKKDWHKINFELELTPVRCAEVQRQLRTLGLATGAKKRGVANRLRT
jgi:hypothetical protein